MTVIRLLILVFFSVGAWQQASAAQTFFNHQQIYEATKEACSNVKAEDLVSSKADRLHAGIFPSQRFNSLLTWLSRESAIKAFNLDYTSENPYISYTLQSEGFKRALLECYPSDQRLKRFFIKSIQNSSLRGKFAASIGHASLFAGGGAGIRLAVQKFGASVKWLIGASVGILTSLKVYSDFDRNKELRQNTDRLCGLNPDDVGIQEKRSLCLFQQSQSSIERLSQELQKRQKADAGFFELLKKENDLVVEIQRLENELSLSPQHEDLQAKIAEARRNLQQVKAGVSQALQTN